MEGVFWNAREGNRERHALKERRWRTAVQDLNGENEDGGGE